MASTTIGDLTFNTASRKLEITRAGKTVYSASLASSLSGFKTIPDVAATTLSTKETVGKHYDWPGLASLNIKKLNIKKAKALDIYEIEWKPQCWDFIPVDIVDLEGSNWYGGAEVYEQRWPSSEQSISMQHFVGHDYLQNERAYGNVLEPFWISSLAAGLYVDENVPLHVSFNENRNKKLELKADFNMSKFQNHKNVFPVLQYTICIGKTMKQLWLSMYSLFCQNPLSVPDELMLRSPIWSTWARYKVHVNEKKVLDYAEDIKRSGFSNSQIEIDDMYTSYYGEFDFDTKKFPHAKSMVDKLHKMGYRVTSWITPFANTDSPAFKEGAEKGYWIKESSGDNPAIIRWWQGKGGILDVTNDDACDWYLRRLKMFQKEYGVDSFKFDAGETNWLPDNMKSVVPMMSPNEYTTRYVELVSNLGGMVETRCGYRSQKFPIFVRIMDKHSWWGYDNGLRTMVPTALLMGVLGYAFILPDMIGGNGYPAGSEAEGLRSTVLPSKELFIRWTQLTAYLPSMQFSICPWQYDDETVQIALQAVKEHEEIVTPLVIQAAKEAMESGAPIIRPLWWLDGEDKVCQTVDSEFLVGNTLLVAPVVEEGARQRDIYFPGGLWRDNLRGQEIAGGKWVHKYRIELDEIATFTKLN